LHKCTAAAEVAGATTSPVHRNVRTMSEDSKMGLFGSKDRNRDQKEKSSKDNSPARYAPYGNDSDTETYDTEALSMMDINDIIGVQSEQVSDSTLESEIAALSQIITESKMEPVEESVLESKQETQQKLFEISSTVSDTVCTMDISNTNVSDINQSKECTVLETQKETLACIKESATFEKLSLIVVEDCTSKNIEPASVKYVKTSDVNTNEVISDTSTICTSKLSSNDKLHVGISLSTVVPDNILQETVQGKQEIDIAFLIDCKKDNPEKMKNQSTDETIKNQDKSRSNTKSITVGGISKSLQLIGEAYDSEDSEERDLNDYDSLKDSPSLSIPEEITSLGGTVIPSTSYNEDESEMIDISKKKTDKSMKLNDDANEIISKEPNIESIADRIEDPNIKITKIEDSSQSVTLQILEEKTDGFVQNKVVEYIDNGASSSIYEQNENYTEMNKMDMIEGISLEYHSSNKISEEIKNISMNISASKSPQQITKNIEENQEIKVKTIKPESSASIHEKLDCVITSSEVLDTIKVSNCSFINDNVKEIVTDECKNENALMKSINETRDSELTETSNKKCDLIKTDNKNDSSQDAIVITESCRSQDITATDKISDKSQETDVKMDFKVTVSDNQDNINLDTNAEEISALDINALQIASSNNKNLILKGNTSPFRSNINETTITIDVVQSMNSHLPNKEISDLCSTDLITPIDTNPIDINNSADMVAYSKKDINVKSSESSVPIEIISQLPSLSGNSEINAINDTVLKELKDLHPASISCKDSENIEDVCESLSKVEKTEMQIFEITSVVVDKNQIETCLMEDKLDQSESSAINEETNSCMKGKLISRNVMPFNILFENNNNSLLIDDFIVSGDNVTNFFCDAKQKNIKKNITEMLNKIEIKKNEGFASNLNQESITEIEKGLEEESETCEMNRILESKISMSDAQATDLRETHSQNDEENSHNETANSFENKLEESININKIPVEEKNVKLEKFIDVNIKNVQLNDISISQEDTKKELLEEQNESIESKNYKDVSNIGNIVQTFCEIESMNNTAKISRNDNDTTNVRNIVESENNMVKNVNTLQDSTDLLSGMNVENLTDELSQDSEVVDNKITIKAIDSLERLLTSHLVPDSENSSSKDVKIKNEALIEETINKNINLLSDSDETNITQNSDYITNVMVDCLTNRDETDINTSTNKITENKDTLRIDEETNAVSVRIIIDDRKKEGSLEIDNSLEQTNLDIGFETNRLESVEDLEENDAKLELSQDILLNSVMSREVLPQRTDIPTIIENSQSSSEISELESAVKFLQESEEQTIDSPLILSPKMVENVVENITKHADAELYVADDEVDNYVNTESELADLRVVTDSISISEAEIISEAAKLENERKFATQIQNVPINTEEKEPKEIDEKFKLNLETEKEHMLKISSNIASTTDSFINTQVIKQLHDKQETIPNIRPLLSEDILKTCKLIPRASVLEERLKEPPKIEIPIPDPAKILESTISPNDSLLIPKDAKVMSYPKILDSPKSGESKNTDTPRKDSEKHSDFENIGSPRIILKIAKSAIADCGEPRSPKSPKIRSATNSPNPEDSPGQKLGKIKLKLSRSGHPSIISNETIEETNQWHTTDSTLSLSPIGMKIKLSKSGDASIIGAEKHENSDDLRETKYKIEEPKRTDSPIGMKIKLSKSGDVSIISDSRQDSMKETFMKHKEKLEIPQGSPKRTESPIGMKIKLSKTASIIQTDRQESSEEYKETVPKRTDSPIGMKIKLSKTGDASIVSPDVPEDAKIKEKQEYSELPKRTESPIGMKIKLSKCKGSAAIIPMDITEDAKEKLEISDPSKRTESPLGMKIKLSKSGDASIIYPENTEDVKEVKYKEKSDIAQESAPKMLESSGIKIKMLKTGETTSSILSDIIEEKDVSQTSESSTASIPKIKISKIMDASIVIDKTEPTEDPKLREAQIEIPKRTESPLGMKIKLSKSGDASIVQNEAATIEDHYSKIAWMHDAEYSKSGVGGGSDTSLGMKIKLFKTGDASVVETPSNITERKDKQQRRREAADSPLEMKIKLSKTGHPTIVACDSHSECSTYKSKEPASLDPTLNFSHRYMEHATVHKEPPLKILKTAHHHSSILQSTRSELTIEPVQMQIRKPSMDNIQQIEISPKRKDVTISPIESKKSKLEAQLSQILPEVTIQPVMCRDQKQQQQQLLFDTKTSLISRQQMNVISQEISITQVRPTKTSTTLDNVSMSDKLKNILCKNTTTNSPGGSSDCEIIEHRPELIIVNENSNSSQDVVIIEEVMPNKIADIKVPKKRGRPRRNPIAQQHVQQQQSSAQILMPRDPLALDDMQQVPMQQFEHRENERPKRTCRSQKSYAPPKRGRGRGLFIL